MCFQGINVMILMGAFFPSKDVICNEELFPYTNLFLPTTSSPSITLVPGIIHLLVPPATMPPTQPTGFSSLTHLSHQVLLKAHSHNPIQIMVLGLPFLMMSLLPPLPYLQVATSTSFSTATDFASSSTQHLIQILLHHSFH